MQLKRISTDNPKMMQDNAAICSDKNANSMTKTPVMLNLVTKLLIVKIPIFSGCTDADSRYTWKPKESAMLSATAIRSKAPTIRALGLLLSNSPKMSPRLVTVEEVAPKLNLSGFFGNARAITHNHSITRSHAEGVKVVCTEIKTIIAWALVLTHTNDLYSTFLQSFFRECDYADIFDNFQAFPRELSA